MTWNTGKNEVIGLIERGELDRVHPDTDFAHILIQKAEQHLRSAAAIAGNDPEGAYALTHDAIRSAFSAVLQAQGLRGTTRGGHLAPQTAVQAQLGAVASVALRPANRIRVTRNNAEYPKSQND